MKQKQTKSKDKKDRKVEIIEGVYLYREEESLSTTIGVHFHGGIPSLATKDERSQRKHYLFSCLFSRIQKRALKIIY